MGVPRIERETIMIFNDEEDLGYVYTCNRKWVRQLEKHDFETTNVYADEKGVYAKEFKVPKKLIKIPRPRTQKEIAQREAQAEKLRKFRFSVKKPAGPSTKVEVKTTIR